MRLISWQIAVTWGYKDGQKRSSALASSITHFLPLEHWNVEHSGTTWNKLEKSGTYQRTQNLVNANLIWYQTFWPLLLPSFLAENCGISFGLFLAFLSAFAPLKRQSSLPTMFTKCIWPLSKGTCTYALLITPGKNSFGAEMQPETIATLRTGKR